MPSSCSLPVSLCSSSLFSAVGGVSSGLISGSISGLFLLVLVLVVGSVVISGSFSGEFPLLLLLSGLFLLVAVVSFVATSNSLPVFGRAAGGEGSWCHRRHGVEGGGWEVQVEAGGGVVRVRGGGGEVRVEGGGVVRVEGHNGSA